VPRRYRIALSAASICCGPGFLRNCERIEHDLAISGLVIVAGKLRDPIRRWNARIWFGVAVSSYGRSGSIGSGVRGKALPGVKILNFSASLSIYES